MAGSTVELRLRWFIESLAIKVIETSLKIEGSICIIEGVEIFVMCIQGAEISVKKCIEGGEGTAGDPREDSGAQLQGLPCQDSKGGHKISKVLIW